MSESELAEDRSSSSSFLSLPSSESDNSEDHGPKSRPKEIIVPEQSQFSIPGIEIEFSTPDARVLEEHITRTKNKKKKKNVFQILQEKRRKEAIERISKMKEEAELECTEIPGSTLHTPAKGPVGMRKKPTGPPKVIHLKKEENKDLKKLVILLGVVLCMFILVVVFFILWIILILQMS